MSSDSQHLDSRELTLKQLPRHEKFQAPVLAHVASPSPAKARRRPASERPSLPTANVAPIKLPSELFAIATSRNSQGDLAFSKALDGIQAAATRLETERTKLVIQSQELQIWDMAREEELVLLRAENEQLEQQLAAVADKVGKGQGRDGVMESLQFALRKARAERDSEMREADSLFNQLQEAKAAAMELGELRAAFSAALANLGDEWSAVPLLAEEARELRARADAAAQDPTNLGHKDMATLLRGLLALASRGAVLQQEAQTLRGEKSALQQALDAAHQQLEQQVEQLRHVGSGGAEPGADTTSEPGRLSGHTNGAQQHQQVSELQQQVSELQAKVAQYRTYLEDNQEEIEGLQGEIKRLRQVAGQAGGEQADVQNRFVHLHAAPRGPHRYGGRSQASSARGPPGSAAAGAPAAGTSASGVAAAAAHPSDPAAICRRLKEQAPPRPLQASQQPQQVAGTPTRHVPSSSSPISTVNYGASPPMAVGSPISQHAAADIAFKVAELQELALRAQQQAADREDEVLRQHEAQLEALRTHLTVQKDIELAEIAAKLEARHTAALAEAQAREADLVNQHARVVSELEAQTAKLAAQHAHALAELHNQMAKLSGQHAAAIAELDAQAAVQATQRLQEREAELGRQHTEALARLAAQGEARIAAGLAEQAAALARQHAVDLRAAEERLEARVAQRAQELEEQLARRFADGQARREAEARRRNAERLAEQAAQLARLHADQAAALGMQHAQAIAEREAQLLDQFERQLVEREGQLANAQADQLRDIDARYAAAAEEAAEAREAQLQRHFAERLAEALRNQQEALVAQAEARLAQERAEMRSELARMAHAQELEGAARQVEEEARRREGELAAQLEAQRRRVEELERQVLKVQITIGSEPPPLPPLPPRPAAQAHQAAGGTVAPPKHITAVATSAADGASSGSSAGEEKEQQPGISDVASNEAGECAVAEEEAEVSGRLDGEDSPADEQLQRYADELEAVFDEAERKRQEAVAQVERQYVDVVARLGREHQQAIAEARTAHELREANLRRTLERQAQEARDAEQRHAEHLKTLQCQLAELLDMLMEERERHSSSTAALEERTSLLAKELDEAQRREAEVLRELSSRQAERPQREDGNRPAPEPAQGARLGASPLGAPPTGDDAEALSSAAKAARTAADAWPDGQALLWPTSTPTSATASAPASRSGTASGDDAAAGLATQPVPTAASATVCLQLDPEAEAATPPSPPPPQQQQHLRDDRQVRLSDHDLASNLLQTLRAMESEGGGGPGDRLWGSIELDPRAAPRRELLGGDPGGRTAAAAAAHMVAGAAAPAAGAAAAKETAAVETVSPVLAWRRKAGPVIGSGAPGQTGTVPGGLGGSGGVAAPTSPEAACRPAAEQAVSDVSPTDAHAPEACTVSPPTSAATAMDTPATATPITLPSNRPAGSSQAHGSTKFAADEWGELVSAPPVTAPAPAAAPGASPGTAAVAGSGGGGGLGYVSEAATSVSTDTEYNSETEFYVDDEDDDEHRGRALTAALAQSPSSANVDLPRPLPPALEELQRRRRSLSAAAAVSASLADADDPVARSGTSDGDESRAGGGEAARDSAGPMRGGEAAGDGGTARVSGGEHSSGSWVLGAAEELEAALTTSSPAVDPWLLLSAANAEPPRPVLEVLTCRRRTQSATTIAAAATMVVNSSDNVDQDLEATLSGPFPVLPRPLAFVQHRTSLLPPLPTAVKAAHTATGDDPGGRTLHGGGGGDGSPTAHLPFTFSEPQASGPAWDGTPISGGSPLASAPAAERGDECTRSDTPQRAVDLAASFDFASPPCAAAAATAVAAASSAPGQIKCKGAIQTREPGLLGGDVHQDEPDGVSGDVGDGEVGSPADGLRISSPDAGRGISSSSSSPVSGGSPRSAVRRLPPLAHRDSWQAAAQSSNLRCRLDRPDGRNSGTDDAGAEEGDAARNVEVTVVDAALDILAGSPPRAGINDAAPGGFAASPSHSATGASPVSGSCPSPGAARAAAGVTPLMVPNPLFDQGGEVSPPWSAADWNAGASPTKRDLVGDGASLPSTPGSESHEGRSANSGTNTEDSPGDRDAASVTKRISDEELASGAWNALYGLPYEPSPPEWDRNNSGREGCRAQADQAIDSTSSSGAASSGGSHGPALGAEEEDSEEEVEGPVAAQGQVAQKGDENSGANGDNSPDDDVRSLLAAGATLSSTELRRRNRRRMGEAPVGPPVGHPIDLLRQGWEFSGGVASPISPRSTPQQDSPLDLPITDPSPRRQQQQLQSVMPPILSPEELQRQHEVQMQELLPLHALQRGRSSPSSARRIGVSSPSPRVSPLGPRASSTAAFGSGAVGSPRTPTHGPLMPDDGQHTAAALVAGSPGTGALSVVAGSVSEPLPMSPLEARQRSRALLGRARSRVAELEGQCRALAASHCHPAAAENPTDADEADEPAVADAAVAAAAQPRLATPNRRWHPEDVSAEESLPVRPAVVRVGARGDGSYSSSDSSALVLATPPPPAPQTAPAEVVDALEDLRGDLNELEALHRLTVRAAVRGPNSSSRVLSPDGPEHRPAVLLLAGLAGGAVAAAAAAAAAASAERAHAGSPRQPVGAPPETRSPREPWPHAAQPRDSPRAPAGAGAATASTSWLPFGAAPVGPSVSAPDAGPAGSVKTATTEAVAGPGPSSATAAAAAAAAVQRYAAAGTPLSAAAAVGQRGPGSPPLDPAVLQLLQLSVQAQLHGQMEQLEAKIAELQRQNQALLAAATAASTPATPLPPSAFRHSVPAGASVGGVGLPLSFGTPLTTGGGASEGGSVAGGAAGAASRGRWTEDVGLTPSGNPAAAMAAFWSAGGAEAGLMRQAGLNGSGGAGAWPLREAWPVFGAAWESTPPAAAAAAAAASGGSQGHASLSVFPTPAATPVGAATPALTPAQAGLRAAALGDVLAGPYSPEELSQLPPALQLFAPPQLRAAALAAVREQSQGNRYSL